MQVNQLHDWLKNWDANFLSSASKGKGKKPNDSGAKKAVLLSGTPGIGKTTSAKLASQMLGFQTIEVSFHYEYLFVQHFVPQLYVRRSFRLMLVTVAERLIPKLKKELVAARLIL